MHFFACYQAAADQRMGQTLLIHASRLFRTRCLGHSKSPHHIFNKNSPLTCTDGAACSCRPFHEPDNIEKTGTRFLLSLMIREGCTKQMESRSDTAPREREPHALQFHFRPGCQCLSPEQAVHGYSHYFRAAGVLSTVQGSRRSG